MRLPLALILLAGACAPAVTEPGNIDPMEAAPPASMVAMTDEAVADDAGFDGAVMEEPVLVPPTPDVEQRADATPSRAQPGAPVPADMTLASDTGGWRGFNPRVRPEPSAFEFICVTAATFCRGTASARVPSGIPCSCGNDAGQTR